MRKRPDNINRNKARVWDSKMREKARQTKLKNPTKYWLGKKRPDIGLKVASKLTGRKLPDQHKTKISKGLIGHKVSAETRKKLSIANSGVKSHLWRGGVSEENKKIRASSEFKTWREAVFKRDNWTCRKCQKRGGMLHPHHVKSFAKHPKSRFTVSNGKTLCAPCHKKTASWGRPKLTNK